MSDKLRKLQKKADRLLQKKASEVFSECYVCGGKYSCVHHYHPKSRSTFLRYDWQNLIPICIGCHNLVHSSQDPNIQNAINRLKGQNWIDELEAKRRNALKQGFKPTIKWIENIIEALK
jgi:5-methylcytosine-specific restriction endonuclease McrA